MNVSTLGSISVDKLYSLAVTRCDQQQWVGALELINLAIDLDAKNMQFYFLRSKIHFFTQQWKSAIADCNRVLTQFPLNTDVHLALADVYLAAGDTMNAVLRYLYACYLKPESMITHFKLGNALLSAWQLSSALNAFEKALALENKAEIWVNLGATYLEMCLNDKANECIDQALQLNPQLGHAFLNKGVVLTRREEFAEAEQAFQQALQLQPELSATIYSNRCTNQSNQNDLPGAIESAAKALELDPDCHLARFNRGLFLLKLGNFREGWQGYEYRFFLRQTTCQLLETAQPLWQGQDLTNRRLLVYTEQGVGDTFQFIRYLPLLKQYGPTLILRTESQLIPFLKTQSWLGVSEWIAEGEALPECDYFVPLLSLPHRLGTDIDSIPAAGAWQVNSAPAPCLLKRKRGKRLRVGLVWAGAPHFKNDHNRSLSLSTLAPLLECKGVDFYSLQYGPRSQDIQALNWQDRLIDLAPQIQSWEDTAKILMELDLVITVDTAVAHLSASLNKPTWILLPFCADFRWLADRSDSPWYPTVKLFRQERFRDWSVPLQDIQTEINLLRRQSVNR